MGFTELTFLFVFLPISILLYLLTEKLFHNDKANNMVLVVMSMLFYFWAGKETVIVFTAIIAFTYMAGLMVQGNKKRMVFPLVLLIGLLVFYKYIGLVSTWINDLTDKDIIKAEDFIIPIGLSFTIFESVSYITDIYRGYAEPGSILDCFTFLSLFPKLISGPIVLWKDFRQQLANRRISMVSVAGGIDRIIIGYAKKAIIADTFGMQIAMINNGISGSGVDTPTMWLRALLYFFQLYFDFSGYSDIAIGVSRIFGFDFKENFNYPYLSTSISEFWRRWHISLGTWFREYVYIPLGGNRRGNVYLHLLTVFLLTGVWHGTGWQFLAWGGVHAFFIIVERAIRDKGWYKRIPVFFKWFATTVIVLFSWILFMSKDLNEALKAFIAMFVSTPGEVNFTWRYYLTNRTLLFLLIAVAGYAFGIGKLNTKVKDITEKKAGMMLKRVFLLLLFVADILYVVNSTYSPFIYFQF